MKNLFTSSKASNATAFKIAAVYFLLSAFWIIFSDTIVSSLQLDPQTQKVVDMFKGLVFVSASALVFFFFLKNYSAKLGQEAPDIKNRRIDWFDPAVIITMFILVFGLFFWMIYLDSNTKYEAELNKDAEIVSESIRLRLSGIEDYLLILANERASGTLNRSEFNNRTRQYIESHPELINITWVDSTYKIIAVSPHEENSEIVGLHLKLPEPKRASASAREKGIPVYTSPFEAIQGQPSFEIWVPVFRENQFIGLLAGVYSCNSLIKHVLSPGIKHKNHISFFSEKGALLGESELSGDFYDIPSAFAELDPPGNGSYIELKKYDTSWLNWKFTALAGIVIILFISLGYSALLLKRDISNRLNAELKLYKNEKKFHLLFETMSQGVVYQDAGGNIVDANPAALKMLGLTIDQLKGRTSLHPGWKCIHKDGSEFPGETHPAMEALKTGEKISGVIMGVYNPELDDYKWLLVNATPQFEAGSKTPASVFTSFSDITELENAGAALAESELKYRTFIDHSMDAILLTDPDGAVLSANKEARRLFGYSHEEILKLDRRDFVNVNDPNLIKLLDKRKKEGKARGELELKRKDGTTFSGEISSALFEYSNGRTFTSMIIRDVTERKEAEIKLKQNEARFHSTLDSMLEGCQIIGFDWKYIYLNDAADKHNRRPKEELLGNVYMDMWPGIEKTHVFALIKETMDERVSNRLENEFVFPDGSKGWFNLSIQPVPEGVFILSIDITEKKDSELETQHEREFTNALLENLPAIFYFYDNNMNFLRWNDNFEIVTGYSAREIKNMHPLDFISEENKDLVASKIEDVFEYGYVELEAEILTSDGKKIPYFINGAKITYENQPCIIGMGMDITKRKETEVFLRKLSQAVEQSPVIVVITDTAGNIEYVNEEFCNNTGYSRIEVIGKNPRLLKSGFHNDDFYKGLWETITSGNDWSGEMLNRRKNGETYWVSERISPLVNDQGVITHYVSIKEDITEKKKMLEELVEAKEKAEASDQIKSEFLAQVSHEIRTPINAIIGFNSLLSLDYKNITTEEFDDIQNGITAASKRIIRTIDLILNSSELQLGTYSPVFTEVDIAKDVFPALKNEFGSLASNKNLKLIFNQAIKNAVVRCDRYGVEQILVNLLDNAIKYTDKGSINITVDRNKEEKVTVSVSDTGIGISPDFIQNLFLPFSQEETGYSRRYEGNGLGLSLVEKYCKINNAKISVESEKGKGSTFTVAFSD